MKSYSVSLAQVLDARERRAAIQNKMLAGAGQGHCLICLTLNIAGEVKRTPMTRMLFGRGVRELKALDLRIADSFMLDEPTGSEGFWLAEEDPAEVKRQLETVEDSFPAARLFDFDVLTADGTKLSRNESRRCLICDAPAAECARSRRHGLDAVKAATDRLLRQFCADELAEAAHDSLLDELYTTPKPGLVDLMSCGAHTDMDVSLFEKSAAALVPYFRDAALMGMDCCEMADLRRRGLEAEQDMFRATGGVNTHRGALFSIGLSVMATAWCMTRDGLVNTKQLRDLIMQVSGQFTPTAGTHGNTAVNAHRVTGALDLAKAGYHQVFAEWLPAYRRFVTEDTPTARHRLLLLIMSQLDDTNVIHRVGYEQAQQVKGEASCLLADYSTAGMEAMNRDYIARNISPGGSADMVALTLFIHSILN